MARPPEPVGRRHQMPPVRRFDPFRPRDLFTSLWSATAMVPVNSGAAAAYQTLFMTMRRLIVGRSLTVRLDDGDLTMTVSEFDSQLDVHGLSVGQLNDVTLVAADIQWRTSLSIRPPLSLHNLHMKPTSPAGAGGRAGRSDPGDADHGARRAVPVGGAPVARRDRGRRRGPAADGPASTDRSRRSGGPTRRHHAVADPRGSSGSARHAGGCRPHSRRTRCSCPRWRTACN